MRPLTVNKLEERCDDDEWYYEIIINKTTYYNGWAMFDVAVFYSHKHIYDKRWFPGIRVIN